MLLEELSSVLFEVGESEFIIEFIIFTLGALRCCHVEFGQKIGPFVAQFTLNNMPKYDALFVLRQVVRETVERCRDFDIVVFSSLDGNLKRNAIYDRIAKDIVKREQCQLSYIQDKPDTRIFVLHKGGYNPSLTEELFNYLSKNGLFSIGGTLLKCYFKIVNFVKKFLYFRMRNA